MTVPANSVMMTVPSLNNPVAQPAFPSRATQFGELGNSQFRVERLAVPSWATHDIESDNEILHTVNTL